MSTYYGKLKKWSTLRGQCKESQWQEDVLIWETLKLYFPNNDLNSNSIIVAAEKSQILLINRKLLLSWGTAFQSFFLF